MSSYRLVEVIGEGAMGTVLRAIQLPLGREVALKCLKQSVARDPTAVERFHREVRTLANLDHTGIIKIFDSGEIDGLTFFAMELVSDGISLDRLVQLEGALPLVRALSLVSQILEAIDHCHSRSVVHRDLKPANVMVRAGDRVLVTDFGLAKRLAGATIDITASGDVVGTPRYMAPELFREAVAWPGSDVWATGVLLYEIATGQNPFAGSGIAAIVGLILRGEYRPPSALRSDLPPAFDALVAEFLQVDPGARIGSARVAAGRIASLLKELTGRPPPHSPERPDTGASASALALEDMPTSRIPLQDEAPAPDGEGSSLPGIGSVFGRYAVKEVLGSGASGTVFRAAQISLGREVALKVLREHWTADSEWHRRFLAEGQLAARVADTGVVKVLDVGQHRGIPFIAYEFVDGSTLRSLIDERGAMPPAEALTTVGAAALALAAIHDAGILHRDIKPDNIFFDRTGRVLVGDLGCAKDLGDAGQATTMGRVLGTPSYLAPELLRGAPASVRSDLYALGVVLFECLTGRRPFQSGDLGELARSVLADPVPSVAAEHPRAAEALDPLVRSFLAKDPGERFAGARVAEERMRDVRTTLARPRRTTDPRPRSHWPPRISSARTDVPGGPAAADDRPAGPYWLAFGVGAAILLAIAIATVRHRREAGPPSPANHPSLPSPPAAGRPTGVPPAPALRGDLVFAAQRALSQIPDPSKDPVSHARRSDPRVAREILTRTFADALEVVRRALEALRLSPGISDGSGGRPAGTAEVERDQILGGRLLILLFRTAVEAGERYSEVVNASIEKKADRELGDLNSLRYEIELDDFRKDLCRRITAAVRPVLDRTPRSGAAAWQVGRLCAAAVGRWTLSKRQEIASRVDDVSTLARSTFPALLAPGRTDPQDADLLGDIICALGHVGATSVARELVSGALPPFARAAEDRAHPPDARTALIHFDLKIAWIQQRFAPRSAATSSSDRARARDELSRLRDLTARIYDGLKSRRARDGDLEAQNLLGAGLLLGRIQDAENQIRALDRELGR